MSTAPQTMAPGASPNEALALMRAKKIHHLPICDGGRVVGLVTDGDLYGLGAGAPTTLRELMRARPYTVSPESPVDEVVREMASHKYGSAAVVVDNGRVVGMFTASDGLRAFADFLKAAR